MCRCWKRSTRTERAEVVTRRHRRARRIPPQSFGSSIILFTPAVELYDLAQWVSLLDDHLWLRRPPASRKTPWSADRLAAGRAWLPAGALARRFRYGCIGLGFFGYLDLWSRSHVVISFGCSGLTLTHVRIGVAETQRWPRTTRDACGPVGNASADMR